MRTHIRMLCAAVLAWQGLAAQAAAPASTAITGAHALVNTCSANPVVQVSRVNTIVGQTSETYTIEGGGNSYTSTGWIPPAIPGVLYGFGTPWYWGFSFSPNTVVTATLTTFANTNLTNPVYTSAIQFNCTTGEVLGIVNTDLTLPVVVPAATQPVPSMALLGPWGLASVLGIGGIAFYMSRRRKSL